MLSELNKPGVNISTVEDPVEYTLDGIHQVQVIREKGLDFSRALRSLMRQDPDIILVGETRDKETAQALWKLLLRSIWFLPHYTQMTLDCNNKTCRDGNSSIFDWSFHNWIGCAKISKKSLQIM